MFRGFFDDPFFGFDEHPHRRRTAIEVEDNGGHHSNDPFGRHVAIPDHFGRDSMVSLMRDPFSMFDNMMSGMRSMRNMMDGTFSESFSSGNEDGFGYSSVSVASYCNDGSGQPKIFEAHSSTKHAPGGLKETRKALRDSDAGLEKMAIGRHIRDRGHVITREKDTRSGQMNENQDFIGLCEEEAPSFHNEWEQAARGRRSRGHHMLPREQQSSHLALDDKPRRKPKYHDA